MILALRQRHRRMFAVISVIIPVAFVAGIAARRPVPVVNELPASLTAGAHDLQPAGELATNAFSRTFVQGHLLRDRARNGKPAISFSAPKDFVKPDLLVYWAAGDDATLDGLPNNAVLLGSFYSAALPLPDEALTSGGQIILFSLADIEIVDVSNPFEIKNIIE